MNIKQDLTGLIGNTPMVDLGRFGERVGCRCRLVAKLEGMNPLSSAKDRVAFALIEDAEQKGLLKKGGTIIEPTSGNTGIGLAFVAAIKGYRLILTMPDTMSAERRGLLSALGAEIVLTDGKLGMAGAIEKTKELASSLPGAFLPDQFANPANALAHQRATGEEIWRDTDGEVAAFVAGVGTGGTITGTGRALKGHNPSVRVVAVEPAGSAVLSGGQPGPHGLQGIGAGFVPEVLDRSVLDEIFPVTDEQAYETVRALAKTEGILAGISGGAALYAAAQLGRRPEYDGQMVVALLPDTGERYLSTGVYNG